jgi:signal transduction histidine kinase
MSQLGMKPGDRFLAVDDCGPGIPEEILSRVFERFFGNAGQDQPGSGLGLSIAKDIADRHGVKIVLSNRAQTSGLTAKLIFPAPQ